MALRERAALDILARQAHPRAFLDQRGEGQRLGRRPVDALAGLDHLGAVVHEPLDGAVDFEALRNRRELLADSFSASSARRSCRGALVLVVGLQARPLPVQPVGLVRLVALADASNSPSRCSRQSAFIFSNSSLVISLPRSAAA
jgi:hypothetical protein